MKRETARRGGGDWAGSGEAGGGGGWEGTDLWGSGNLRLLIFNGAPHEQLRESLLHRGFGGARNARLLVDHAPIQSACELRLGCSFRLGHVHLNRARRSAICRH